MDDIISILAESFLIKVQGYHKLVNKKHKQIISDTISSDIRLFTNLIYPNVSKRANEAAQTLGIDIRKIKWCQQNKIDPDRSIFHYEHFYTVKDIKTLILNSTTVEEIKNILKHNTKIVWILKSENEILDELKYRSDRPDPYLAYKEANIEILN